MANKLIQLTNGTDNVFPVVGVKSKRVTKTTDSSGNINMEISQNNGYPIAIAYRGTTLTADLIRYNFGIYYTAWYVTFSKNSANFTPYANTEFVFDVYYIPIS